LLPELEAILNGYSGEWQGEFEAGPGKAPVARAPKPMVDAKKITCLRSPNRAAILKKIGTNDPQAVLEAACQRAVAMLNNTINELTRIKASVTAGDPIGWPLINDTLAWSMQNRMLMRVQDRATWTGTGRRNAGLIIRWLTNIRNTIAGGELFFDCLFTAKICGNLGNEVCCDPGTRALSRPGRMQVFLCMEFWQPTIAHTPEENLDYQAQTIIHEVSHIFYDTEDKGLGPGRAECISQFVADANGSKIHPSFIGQCRGAGPGNP